MDQQDRQLDEIFSYYDSVDKPAQQEEIISMLQEIQDVYGFISPEIKKRASDISGVKETVISCLIRMFPSLKEANYHHVVTVCNGERCKRKNGNEILQAVKKELQIDGKCVSGKPMLSKNGEVLLKMQNCLKQCRTSPNLMIDGKIYHQVKVEDLPGLLSFTTSN